MRTGSTTLARWLALELGYKLYSEPHCDIVEVDKPLDSEDNIVVKEIWHHIEGMVGLNDYIKGFDRVIGLVREDIRDCSISIVHFKDLDWKDKHNRYMINEEWIAQNEEEIQRLYSEIKDRNDKIQRICSFNVTYEGIYNTKEDLDRLCSYIGLKELKHSYLLGSEYKLRNNLKLI